MPPLDPFKPEGPLDSVTMRTHNSGLGFSLVGRASKISIFGFQNMEIQQIEYAHYFNDPNICINFTEN